MLGYEQEHHAMYLSRNCDLAVYAGVWLWGMEMEISVTLRACAFQEGLHIFNIA